MKLKKKGLTNDEKKRKKRRIQTVSLFNFFLFFILYCTNDFMYFCFMFFGIVVTEYFWSSQHERDRLQVYYISGRRKGTEEKRKKNH